MTTNTVDSAGDEQQLRQAAGGSDVGVLLRRRLAQVAPFLALGAVVAAICVVFWPGDMDPDFVDEFTQAKTGVFGDWHTPILSAAWRVVVLIGLKSPGWVLVAGVLALIVGIYLVLRIRLSRGWAAGLALGVFVFPPVLGRATHLGVDTWFSAFLLCGFGLVGRAIRTRGHQRRLSLGAALICAFLAGAARHNALPAIIALGSAITAGTVAARWKGWRHAVGLVTGGVAVAGGCFALQLAIERVVLHAEAMHPEQITMAYDLIRLSKSEHRVLLPADVYPLQDLRYLTQWSTTVNAEPLFYSSNAAIPSHLTGARLASLERAWRSAIVDHPLGYLRVRASLESYQLALTGHPLAAYGSDAAWAAKVTGHGPSFPGAREWALNFVGLGTSHQATHESDGGPLQTIWIYAVVLVVVSAWFLRGARLDDRLSGLLGLGVITYGFTFVFTAPEADYRYMYPVVLSGIVLAVPLAVQLVTTARLRRSTALRRGRRTSSVEIKQARQAEQGGCRQLAHPANK